jgi:hypothetical protein
MSKENDNDAAPRTFHAQVVQPLIICIISKIRLLLPEYERYEATGKGLISSARLTEDGRISILLDLQQTLPDIPKDYANEVKEYAIDTISYSDAPPMSIVIMIVGSRGMFNIAIL